MFCYKPLRFFSGEVRDFSLILFAPNPSILSNWPCQRVDLELQRSYEADLCFHSPSFSGDGALKFAKSDRNLRNTPPPDRRFSLYPVSAKFPRRIAPRIITLTQG